MHKLTLSALFTVTALALAQSPAHALVTQFGPLTAPESHPLGDIPDSQAFVRYISTAGGYSLEVPEGWARTVSSSKATFASKLNQLEVSSVPAATSPSVASVRSGILAALSKADPSLKVTLLKTVTLPAGPAVLARFTSLGAANEVTGRREALENDLYVLNRGKRQMVLRLSAPKGSDNVDAWTRMARSLAWR